MSLSRSREKVSERSDDGWERHSAHPDHNEVTPPIEATRSRQPGVSHTSVRRRQAGRPRRRQTRQCGCFGDVAVLVGAMDCQDGSVGMEKDKVSSRLSDLSEACGFEKGEDVGQADAVDQAASCFGEPDRGRRDRPRRSNSASNAAAPRRASASVPATAHSPFTSGEVTQCSPDDRIRCSKRGASDMVVTHELI